MNRMNEKQRPDGDRQEDETKPDRSIAIKEQEKKRDSTANQLREAEKGNSDTYSGAIKEDETLGIP